MVNLELRGSLSFGLKYWCHNATSSGWWSFFAALKSLKCNKYYFFMTFKWTFSHNEYILHEATTILVISPKCLDNSVRGGQDFVCDTDWVGKSTVCFCSRNNIRIYLVRCWGFMWAYVVVHINITGYLQGFEQKKTLSLTTKAIGNTKGLFSSCIIWDNISQWHSVNNNETENESRTKLSDYR